MNIRPQQNRSGIVIRFRIEGADFQFAPLRGGKWKNEQDIKLVAAIATKIENDIRAGVFDPSLEKYRHKICSEVAVPAKSHQKIRWLEVWDAFVKSLKLSENTAADHYACVRAMIVKAENPPLVKGDWLTARSDLAASTFNRRLSMLQNALTGRSGNR